MVAWFAAVVIVLEFVPLVLQRMIEWLQTVGLWHDLGAKKVPDVGQWFSVPVLVGVFIGGLFVRALVRARNRVVIDQFVDYTQDDCTAVKGLATLLVDELNSLSQLYRDVNERLSVPLAVGAEQRGGFGRGKEAGTFLTVRADDVSDLLQGGVAAEVKVDVGGVLIPVGAVLALLGRLVRGPRVIGSVHRTAAGGGPTLTAQLVGRGPVLTWRVDHNGATSSSLATAYGPAMVSEMAVRMFADLNFGGEARWRAVQEFTQYLRLYQDSRRTPRHRGRLLKQAESLLIGAVAEDDGFDLAFYNLGVIYSQLAQEELTAAQASDVVRWRLDVEPDQIRQERNAAATLAFNRALDRNRGRWEAHYALAVHRFASMDPPVLPGATPTCAQEDALADVERLCRRVLELRPQSAYADDLLGMALVRLGKFDEGIKHHRRAVRRWWRKLCRAERRAAARPTGRPTQLLRARANATAALHNLGLAHMSHGMAPSSASRIGSFSLIRRLSFLRAGLYFRQAAKLAPPETAAACYFEQGRSREEWGTRPPGAARKRRLDKAANSYRRAIRIQPDNPEYRAVLARVLARRKRAFSLEDRETREAVEATFDCLAPVFARAVERFAPRSVSDTCKATLEALNATLHFPQPESPQVGDLNSLRARLATDLAPKRNDCKIDQSIARLEADRERLMSDATWESSTNGGIPDIVVKWKRTQVELALARLYGKKGQWKKNLDLLQHTANRLADDRVQIGRLGLHIRCAQAQRHIATIGNGRPCRTGLGKALESAELGLRIDPLTSAGRREAGRIHFALGQFTDAINAWTQALSLIPNDPFLYLKLGTCHWHIAEQRRDAGGNPGAALEQATACFEEALILSGGEYKEGKAWAHLWLGRVLIERAEVEDAMGQLSTAAAFEWTRLPALVLVGEALTAAQQYAAGRTTLRNALSEAESLNGKLHAQDEENYGEDLTPARLRHRALVALSRVPPEGLRDRGRLRVGTGRKRQRSAGRDHGANSP